ncbi:unnamed protein product [Mesocestoides corti]|uniref:Ribonuclease P protein subunit p30 n=1 Tax=Mesocestoides corti TaxID=53468 RepID=A0A0R3UE95_MESCO|nr:unnamed protein product [Mesocestoides corti]
MDAKYYDLNVPRAAASPELLARLLDCDYLYAAIATTVRIDDFNFANVNKSAKEDRQQMRASLTKQLTPLTASELTTLLQNSEKFRSSSSNKFPALSPPRLFNRLTLTCADPDLASLFFKEFSDRIRTFDVVAFEPLSSAALTYIIESPNSPPIDLITANVAHLPSVNEFRPSSKHCAQCLRQGVYIEIPLSPALFRSGLPPTNRIGLASLLTHLDSVCQFHFPRLLVVSSGAQTGWEIRRPQAVASVLSAICSTIAKGGAPLVMQQTNPWQALSRGLARRRTKTAHGAAILLRLLADPSVTEVTKLPTANEGETANEETASSPTKVELGNPSIGQPSTAAESKRPRFSKNKRKRELSKSLPSRGSGVKVDNVTVDLEDIASPMKKNIRS